MAITYCKGPRLVWRLASSASLVCSIALSQNALAGEPRVELQAGPSYMDDHGAAAVFIEVMGQQKEVADLQLTWQPVASLGWIDQRTIFRYDASRYRASRSTELLAGGARWHLGNRQAWYQPLFFGFELAYNHQATQALSSHYEFVSTLGWQGRRFSFQVRHISNGGLHDPNRGETMALVGVGFSH